MIIDFAALRSGQTSMAEVTSAIQHADLRRETDEFFTELEAILAGATDATVLFVPHDPAATEDNERGWTVSHVVAHFTATLEAGAAGAAMLARGVQVQERLRYETPWEELSTVKQVQARLRESQRMCRAFLDAWPDEPHLDLVVTPIPALGPMNAIGLAALGIAHGQTHLAQVRETVRQAAAV